MKRAVCGILISLLLLTPLCQGAQAASPVRGAAGVVSAALSQLDSEEGARGYSTYGQWFGIPNGHWCDMFVSWCASQAGVSEAVFPRSAGCTAHVRQFEEMGRYQISAARGGSYVPQQGDVIFFYDEERYPSANVVRHVGIVLWVENGYVFTVEGNTLTSRRDVLPADEDTPEVKPALRPKDYVVVKYYPLDAPGIHGYAVPDYDSREALNREGWVDLGKYEPLREVFDTLAAEGLMPGTSAYTFSPRYGMTRGDFLTLIMKMYGLSGWDRETVPFTDVPEKSGYYDAAMTARSAGIVSAGGDGAFHPDTYVSGEAAQEIISRTLAYVGQADRVFQFTQGDYSYLGTPYTIRADIAAAVYALRTQMASPTEAEEEVTVNGRRLNGVLLRVGDDLYAPLKPLQKMFPSLTILGSRASKEEQLSDSTEHANRVVLSQMPLQRRNKSAAVTGFWYQGERYVMLQPTAEFLGAALEQSEARSAK